MIRKNSGYRPSENLNISARVLGFERNDGSQVLYVLYSVLAIIKSVGFYV